MKTKLYTLFFICIATISMAQVNEQDSLALVALYDSTDGPNWTCGCNEGWLTEPVGTWNGISILEGRVVEINLCGGVMSCGPCGLNGTIPPVIGDLDFLETLYLNNNIELTGNIPTTLATLTNLKFLDLANCSLLGTFPNIANLTNIQTLNASYNTLDSLTQLPFFPDAYLLAFTNNKLTFEDFEYNMHQIINISPQDSIDQEQDINANLFTTCIMSTYCGGENNLYQWYFNNNPIEGATESTYTLNNVIEANQGVYTCAVTNTVVTGLTLWRKPITLHVNTSGIEDTNNESIIVEKSGDNLLITNLHDNCNINVYTVEGRLLHSCVGEKDGTATIGISKFPKGVLILKIANENDTFISKKIINY